MKRFYLKDFVFGFADAEREVTRLPNIIDKAFYDPNDNIKKLLDSHEFLLIGRKGVGKTAFGAKIEKLAEKDDYFKVERLIMKEFNYNILRKLSSSNLKGGERYSIHWKEVLLLKVYEILESFANEFEKPDSFSEMIYTLKKHGLLKGESMMQVISTISKKNFSILLPLSLGGSLDLGEEELELKTPYQIVDVLKEILQSVFIPNYKIRIVIDGIDDVLRVKQYQSEIMSGLISSCDYLNTKFYKWRLPIKFIVLARPKILNKVTDPDIDKTLIDCSIRLEWNEKNNINIRNSELMGLLKKRFEISGVPENELDMVWDRIFPSKIWNYSSWNFILKHTLYRPRDIIQFLVECQKKYGHKDHLLAPEVHKVLKDYSKNYFYIEMKSDLAGFLPDKIIENISSILNTVGKKPFTYSEWRRAVEEVSLNENEGKLIIRAMYENGYIGMKKLKNNRNVTIFKYKHNHEPFSFDERFVLHKALQVWIKN